MELETGAILFAKVPSKGRVKTRLAAQIGDIGALEVYRCLLNRAFLVLCELRCRRFVFWDQEWSTPLIEHQVKQRIQVGSSLGQRMKNALDQVRSEGISRAVIFGSDIPGVTARMVEEALAALTDVDLVLGPAFDGGYYLIGCKTKEEIYVPVLKEMGWSSSSLLEDTLRISRERGWSYCLLPMLRDIDTLDDLEEWISGVDTA